MNNFNSDCLSDFIKCKSIWFLFLTELNWNPSAINPLELVPESFRDAVVIGSDENIDIALLKVDAETTLEFVEFGDSDISRVGDWVKFIV